MSEIVPTWLDVVLEQCSSRCLDSDADRAAVHDAIIEAFPREALLNVIGGTIAAQLKSRAISDGRKATSTPIARNVVESAAGVLSLTVDQVKEHDLRAALVDACNLAEALTELGELGGDIETQTSAELARLRKVAG